MRYRSNRKAKLRTICASHALYKQETSDRFGPAPGAAARNGAALVAPEADRDRRGAREQRVRGAADPGHRAAAREALLRAARHRERDAHAAEAHRAHQSRARDGVGLQDAAGTRDEAQRGA